VLLNMRLLAVVIQASSAAVLLLPEKLREVPAGMNMAVPANKQQATTAEAAKGVMVRCTHCCCL
jgi:hypothetical protein